MLDALCPFFLVRFIAIRVSSKSYAVAASRALRRTASTSSRRGMASEQLTRLTTTAAAAFPYLRHSARPCPLYSAYKKPAANPSPPPIAQVTGIGNGAADADASRV